MARLAPYRSLGYPVVECEATRSATSLAGDAWLATASVLIGQSGMGKSTILNALCPHARARIGDVSDALGQRPAHDDRDDALPLPATPAAWIVDSPGMKVFGIAHLDPRCSPARVRRDCARSSAAAASATAATIASRGARSRDAVDDGRVAPQRLALLHALRREGEASATR